MWVVNLEYHMSVVQESRGWLKWLEAYQNKPKSCTWI